ncbi:MAG: hypothetical protein ACR2PL_12050 [Dehalococcoidia bacterium]
MASSSQDAGASISRSTAKRRDSLRWTCRAVLQLGATTTTVAGISALGLLRGGSPAGVLAHNLPPGQFGSPLYDAALAASGGYKGVFQSPNVESTAPAGKTLNHLLLVQFKNWLNGFQFSYQASPADLHTVVATYASANLLTYGDAVWERYRLGEKYNLIDPATGAPATRNLWPSRFSVDATGDPDSADSFYQDTGIEALQKRGTVFLT